LHRRSNPAGRLASCQSSERMHAKSLRRSHNRANQRFS